MKKNRKNKKAINRQPSTTHFLLFVYPRVSHNWAANTIGLLKLKCHNPLKSIHSSCVWKAGYFLSDLACFLAPCLSGVNKLPFVKILESAFTTAPKKQPGEKKSNPCPLACYLWFNTFKWFKNDIFGWYFVNNSDCIRLLNILSTHQTVFWKSPQS